MSNKNNGNGEITRVSRQIAVYKTDKRLIEFNDNLNTAPIGAYAHIHAQGDTLSIGQGNGDGRKIYSTVRIILQDYSNGTGDNTVRVMANISPDEAQYIYSRANACVEKFEFASEKIFGQPDTDGYSILTKLKIARYPVDKDNKPRNYPWYLECENGKGIAEKNTTGGTYCKKDSFVSTGKVYINISDLDFFRLMNRVSSYIHVWESQYGASLMISGRNAVDIQTQTASKGANSNEQAS